MTPPTQVRAASKPDVEGEAPAGAPPKIPNDGPSVRPPTRKRRSAPPLTTPSAEEGGSETAMAPRAMSYGAGRGFSRTPFAHHERKRARSFAGSESGASRAACAEQWLQLP